MILGKDRHPAARCFEEINDAVEALTQRPVVFNAHAFPNEIPPGAVVFNLENVPGQVQPTAFQNHEVWDFSSRNVEAWRPRAVTHVPIGYHPTMERFQMRPWEERDIDVVFCGCMNERRASVLNELRAKGLNVHVIGPGEAYGAERDAILARSKLALNMLFHEGGVFPVLRAAHAAANRLPMLSEQAPAAPFWTTGGRCPYYKLADRCEWLLQRPDLLQELAEETYLTFKAQPLVLPDPWKTLRSPPPWDLEAMYQERRGAPVSKIPLVCIAVPTYRETERVAKAARVSRNAVREDLARHGIDSFVLHLDGDSLICRMRQRACHMFLSSSATHLLFWDGDIECMTPDCIRKMVETRHDVVAGAVPFKDNTGRTVHNLWPEDYERMRAGERFALDQGCIEVRDAGTGVMLISRRALIELQKAHPELLHWSVGAGADHGAPLWALFDTGVVDGVYQSEDFMFCHRWQQLGQRVYVYIPGRFRHWGETGFEGSFTEQYGLIAHSPDSA